MNIIQSLIRTYFLNTCMDVFFNKIQGTISSGLKNLDLALNSCGFNKDDIVEGMRFSRIENIRDENSHSIFYDCTVTYIDHDPEDSWVEFSYRSALDKWEDEPAPIFDNNPGSDEDELGSFDFYL